jgi:chorismate--pyruvate lyase
MRCAALAGQGQTPLGELVFTSGAAQRRELQVATFAVEQSRWCRAAIVWGRRSLLEWQGIPLLVHELFLPGLVDDKESM